MPTKIEWAEETWNPVTGCSKISEGCKNCYAERMAKRLAGRYGYRKDEPFRPTFHPDKLNEPLKWKKPRRVFVCSMGDLFHKYISFIQIDRIFKTVCECRGKHTFIFLTKRPEIMAEWFKHAQKDHPGWFSPFTGMLDLWGCWFGVTCENQEQADKRIPILLQIPAAVRFVSVEPMLKPIDLRLDSRNDLGRWDSTGMSLPLHKIDWVICGGESGPGARPMHPDWVRSLGDQAVQAGVPFFFKHFGEWADYFSQPGSDGPRWTPEAKRLDSLPYKYVTPDGHIDGVARYGSAKMVRVGKKASGRLLDGRTWEEFPK